MSVIKDKIKPRTTILPHPVASTIYRRNACSSWSDSSAAAVAVPVKPFPFEIARGPISCDFQSTSLAFPLFLFFLPLSDMNRLAKAAAKDCGRRASSKFAVKISPLRFHSCCSTLDRSVGRRQKIPICYDTKETSSKADITAAAAKYSSPLSLSLA
jgi:hypothetical protein